MYLFAPISLLLLTSCAPDILLVQSEYLTTDRYASVWVDTPDPEKYLWRCSQRLLIEWNPPKSYAYDAAFLELVINYRNFTTECETIPLSHPRGRICYFINEDKFSETGGMFSYRARLISRGVVIAESCHQLFEEIIQLQE